MKQRIFILGASGNVGRELIRQIVEKDSNGKHINPSEIIGIANSKHYIFNSGGVDRNLLGEISLGRKHAISNLKKKGKQLNNLIELIKLVKDNGMDGEVVFADVTAGKKELLDFHKCVIHDSSNFLVTANKNPISLFGLEDFLYLTSYSGRYDTNTTVMGGAGVLGFVDERVNKINDNLSKIEGAFSGTLSYIFSALDDGKKTFSEIVKEAKEEGYTEPNPWDDLNGLDVARKLVILARYAGLAVNISDINIQPVISSKYSKFDGDEFLEEIKNEDKAFLKAIKQAKEKGEVLRYVGEIFYKKGDLKLIVGLKNVAKDSDLGTLSGTSNLAVVETEILRNPQPHTIKSRGAGLSVTAGAVRVGIAKMLPNNIITK